jgi:hypothetical protein
VVRRIDEGINYTNRIMGWVGGEIKEKNGDSVCWGGCGWTDGHTDSSLSTFTQEVSDLGRHGGYSQ